MNHVAVDLGSRQSQFCVRSSTGEIEQEGRVATPKLESFFSELPHSRVVLETCAESFAVAEMAKRAGHVVSLVPASLAPSLGVGQRGVKSDKRDAQNLSLASARMETLPSVHLPSMVAREHRALLTSRDALVQSRTLFVNSVRGWLRTQLLRVRAVKPAAFPGEVRKLALSRATGLPTHIESLLSIVDALNEQIAKLTSEVKRLANEDSVCERLMTMPGVGPVTALSFKATVDNVGRFKTPHALQSFLGLTPGERSSGETSQKTGITKAGPTRTRWVLVQAAWSAFNTQPNEPMVRWARELTLRKPRPVAVVALARKMSGILWAMWTHQKAYDPAYEVKRAPVVTAS